MEGINYENKLKQLQAASTNSPMGLYSGELIIRRIFASEIWGAYFQEGLFSFPFFVFCFLFSVSCKSFRCSFFLFSSIHKDVSGVYRFVHARETA